MLRRALDHRFVSLHASEYVDGDMPERQRRRVENHTAICPQCRAVIASLRRMLEALPGLSAAGRPDVAEGVLTRLDHER